MGRLIKILFGAIWGATKYIKTKKQNNKKNKNMVAKISWTRVPFVRPSPICYNSTYYIDLYLSM